MISSEQQKNGESEEDLMKQHRMKRVGSGRAASGRRRNSFDYFNAIQMLGIIINTSTLINQIIN